jgi:hypothetical protein
MYSDYFNMIKEKSIKGNDQSKFLFKSNPFQPETQSKIEDENTYNLIKKFCMSYF